MCVCVCVCVCVLAIQSCLSLCNPMDYSPPGYSVHGILQARILEWAAIPFFRRSSPPRDQTWASGIAGRFFTTWASVVVESLSCVRLFATPKTITHQGFLFFTISWSLHKLMSIESVMTFNHLILCCPLSACPQSLLASVCFPMSWLFASVCQSIRASASASVLPMNSQGWFLLELTGLIFLLSKGLSTVFSNTTVWKHQFFDSQPFIWLNSYTIHDYWKNHSFGYMDLCW